MALKTPTTPLTITATQGSADAFVQGSTLTGLTGRQAYNVAAVIFELSTLGAVSPDGDISIALSRRSKTAMPLYSDSDVIHKWMFSISLTTSGQVIIPNTYVYVPQLQIPVVEETLYLDLDSTNTGLTITGICRLEVELDTISDIDRLNLIARSLT